MPVLALDVDGVLLDPGRHGAGHWTDEMERSFAITRSQFREAFFMRSWDDVVNGRRPVEDGVAEALLALGADLAVEDFLRVWFEADFEPIDEAIALACRAGDVVFVDDLEHNVDQARTAGRRAVHAVPEGTASDWVVEVEQLLGL